MLGRSGFSVFAVLALSCTSGSENQCVKNADCDGGSICGSTGQCQELCISDPDCPAQHICDSELCIPGARDAVPSITHLRGNGSSAETFADAIKISGTNFEGAAVRLLTPDPVTLELRTSAATEIEAVLPEALTAGEYVIQVANAAGETTAAMKLLQGEKGDKGDPSSNSQIRTLLAQGGVHLGDSKTAGFAPVDRSAVTVTNQGLGSFNEQPLFDGDTTTRAWDTDSAKPGAYVQLEFSAAQEVVRVALSVADEGPAQARYAIEYSADGSIWRRVPGVLSPVVNSTVQKQWQSVGAQRYWRLLLLNTPSTDVGAALAVAQATQLTMSVPTPGPALTVTDRGWVSFGGDQPTAALDVKGSIRHGGLLGRVCPADHYLSLGYCLRKGTVAEQSSCTTGTLLRGVCYQWANPADMCQQLTSGGALLACETAGGRLCSVAELDRLDKTGCGADGAYQWAMLVPSPVTIPTTDTPMTGRCVRGGGGIAAAGQPVAIWSIDDIAGCAAGGRRNVTAESTDTAYAACCF